MARQNNKYILKVKGGEEIEVRCSTLDEAKVVARNINKPIESVQRVYKNELRVVQNTRGKVHAV